MHKAEAKFAMARTPSPARETRALPRIPLKQRTLRYALVRNWSSLFLNRTLNVVSDP
jgi:hypothetical protein